MSDVAQLTQSLAGRYAIEREIGAGGMATVYLARDLKHDRQVALKVLRKDLAASLGAERFHREIRVAAAFQHPHIVPLYDSGEADGLLFYVMPYIAGTSLRQKLLKEGELPINDAVRILRDVADAVAAAHEHGVVHRDLKPENVMLSGRHALVTDFGVAKAVSESTGRQVLTTMGIALGTPTYMSPEQATADPHLDHRADIYAFGVIAYELLTGRPPFTGTSPQEVLAAHVTAAVEPVTKHRTSIPPVLAALVMRCLEKKPADRWQRADEMIPQLEAVLTPSGGMTPTATAPFPSTTATAPAAGGKRSWIVGVAAGVVLLVVAAYVVSRGRASTPATAGGDLSVAVLYIDNISRDTADQYLADGLTEDLATSLGHVSRLVVKAPSAVKRVQAANRGNLPEIGRALGVKYILEGSLRRTAGGVRIGARLVEREDETQAWSNTYDATPASLLDLPAQIAQDVGRALTGGLDRQETAAAAKRPTRNAEAYDAYLRGNYYLGQRTPEAATAAHRAYGRAVQLDSSFVSALARDAHIYAQQADYLWIPPGETPRSLAARALAMVDRALAHDSANADAWTARAYALSATGGVIKSLGAARVAAERAVALDPRSIEAQNRLGWILFASGDLDGAARQGRQVLSLDPRFYNGYRLVGEPAYYQGRKAEALAMLDSAILVAPASVGAREWRARIRLARGDTAGARADAIEDAQRGSRATYLLPYVAATAGDVAPARRWLAESRPAARNEAEATGLVFLALGDRTRAIDELVRREGEVDLRLVSAPEFAPVVRDPRFKALVERVRARTMVR